MKKINNIFIIGICCVMLAACDNYDYNDKVNSVKVVSADTSIPAAGGTKSIAAKYSNQISAYSNDKWLNVSFNGDSVKVSANENNTCSSRHTTVVIKSGKDSTIVNVSQFGLIFSYNGNKTVKCDKSGGVFSYKIKCNEPKALITFGSNVNWISGKFANDSLSISILPNSEGVKRTGYLTYTYGGNTDTLNVVQSKINIKDFIGEWKLKCSIGTSTDYEDDPDSFKDTTYDVTTTANATGDSLYISMNKGKFVMHALLDDDANLIFSAGDYIGVYNSYYAYLCLVDIDQGSYTWNSSRTYTATYSEDDSHSYYNFGDNGSWSGNTVTGFDICLYSVKEAASYALQQEGFLYMINPVMYRDK